MSDFLRPEAVAFLRRHQGTLAIATLIAVGLWWGIGSGGIVRVLGWAMVVLGAMLGWAALQRRRFAAAQDGPGMVEVVEGQISYFGPAGGGFAALSEIAEIHLAERGGRRAWVLVTPGQPELVIPVGAEGSDALFDAFGSLPGLTGAALVAAVSGEDGPSSGIGLPALRPDSPVLRRVWKRPPQAIR